jgi:hypothetical protein
MGGQRHAPGALPRGQRTVTSFAGHWVVPRASLDVCGKSRHTEIRSPDCPARSESNIVSSVFPPPLKICAFKCVCWTKTERVDSEQTHAVGQSNALIATVTIMVRLTDS